MLLYFLGCFGLILCHAHATTRPNIVFLVVESTDGATWQRGYSDDAIPLPNIRRLEDMGGTSFHRHYRSSISLSL